MKPEELKHLKELCDKATPEPWEFWDNRGKPIRDLVFPEKIIGYIEGDAAQGVRIGDTNRTLTRPEDSLFIAAAREALPKLIEEVERLREALRKLEWANLEPHPFYQVMMACCPACCGKFKGSGHKDDCWLAAELIREGGE